MTSEPIQSYHSCVIVGAGLAGLYAAQQLKDRYPDVLVVEAQDHVGGRVRQVNMFMPTLQSSRCAMCHMSIASQNSWGTSSAAAAAAAAAATASSSAAVGCCWGLESVQQSH
jgi:monoamine oxidase